MSVLASIEPNSLQVEAGAEASLVVRVRNRGSIVDQYDIAVVGPTAPWVTVDPPSLRLFPDKEGEARVTFRPPRAPNPAADRYPFGVAVRAAADASSQTVEEGHIIVDPFVQLASEIVPQTSRGALSGSHDITVHNAGNAVAEVSIKASDPDRLLDFEVVPERDGLTPGGSGTVRLKVKPKATFFFGSPKRIPFAVSIDEATAGSYQIPATLEQRAIIPGWIKPAFALTITAIAAFAFLPKILFPPTPSAAPTQTVIVTPTPFITPTPVPITPPPPTAPPPTVVVPTAEIFGPANTLVAAGDVNGLAPDSGLTILCPKKNACRDELKTLVVQTLSNLGQNVTGTKLLKYSTTVVGTLPIIATWDNRYKYSVNFVDLFAKKVAIDLAPRLSGYPAYAYITDDDGSQHWFTIPNDTADQLLNGLYNLALFWPIPPADPNFAGSYGSTFYDNAVYNGQFLKFLSFGVPK